MIKLVKKFLIISLLIITNFIVYIAKFINSFIKENKDNIKKYYRSFRCVLKEELEK